jgi:hypothetical protein
MVGGGWWLIVHSLIQLIAHSLIQLSIVGHCCRFLCCFVASLYRPVDNIIAKADEQDKNKQDQEWNKIAGKKYGGNGVHGEA